MPHNIAHFNFQIIQQGEPLVMEKTKKRSMTLTAGLEPVRASHNIRQESSPTLQNSCALKKGKKTKGGCWLNLEKKPRKIRLRSTQVK